MNNKNCSEMFPKISGSKRNIVFIHPSLKLENILVCEVSKYKEWF